MGRWSVAAWSFFGALAVATATAAPAWAWEHTTTQSAQPPCPGEERGLAWYALRVPYIIGAEGRRSEFSRADFEGVVRKAFQAWEDAPGAYLGFDEAHSDP